MTLSSLLDEFGKVSYVASDAQILPNLNS